MKIMHTVSLAIVLFLLSADSCPGMDIKKAVLYDDQAFISFDQEFSGRVSLNAPPEMVPDSLVLTPMTGASIRSVAVEPLRSVSGKAKDLKDALEKKQTVLAVLKRDQAMLEKQIDIIYDAAGSKGKATSFERARLSDALSFIETRVNALNGRIVELTRKTEKTELEIKDLESQLNRLSRNPGYRIEITGNGPVAISYVVRSASWKPEYRVNASPGASQLVIETSVQAMQSSGMDWDIKELFVSTGRPSFGIQAPELQPWYLYKPSRRGARLKTESYDMAPMASAPMEEAMATVEATTTSYRIGTAKDIRLPGDGTPATFKIARQTLQADFSLISIPKHREAAFLRADCTLKGNAPMVPGSYSSFVDGVFSGSGEMKRFEPGQKIALDLGVDEGVRVLRKETQAFHDKTLTGKDRVTYTYEISVENTRAQKAVLTVKDQIPVSQDKSIEVDLIRTTPEAKPDQEGILSWSMELGPKEKQKASFSFAVIGAMPIPF